MDSRMSPTDTIYIAKAEECLSGAESELVNNRYNNCANRCYYACFQAAIAALIRNHIEPESRGGEWGHGFVQARFAGELIGRRKSYSSNLRETLARLLMLRQLADYEAQNVSETQARRAIRAAGSFLDAITSKGGES